MAFNEREQQADPKDPTCEARDEPMSGGVLPVRLSEAVERRKQVGLFHRSVREER